MTHSPLIVVTNDDGIDSPGLHAAAEALWPLGEVLIAAPRRQQSATGRSLRADPGAVFEARALTVAGKGVTGWCLDASPAATVRHALSCLTGGRRADLVVSGINFGENLGTNVTASGTVGAALQAASWGYPSLAVSLEVDPSLHYSYSGSDVDWDPAVAIFRRAAAAALARTWPEDVHILKIDIPEGSDESTPWRIARQSLEPGWYSAVDGPRIDSPVGAAKGRRGPLPGRELADGDDMDILLRRHEVAVTPLSIDMTSRVSFGDVAALFE